MPNKIFLIKKFDFVRGWFVLSLYIFEYLGICHAIAKCTAGLRKRRFINCSTNERPLLLHFKSFRLRHFRLRSKNRIAFGDLLRSEAHRLRRYRFVNQNRVAFGDFHLSDVRRLTRILLLHSYCFLWAESIFTSLYFLILSSVPRLIQRRTMPWRNQRLDRA